MTHPTGDSRRETGWLSAAIDTAKLLWRRAERFVRSRLVWSHLYHTASYLKSALWVVPFLAILLVILLVPVLRALDNLLGWRIVGLGTAGATSLFQTVITLALSFLVFTFGSLLVAIQVAGGQLTPRIIATTLLRDNVVRFSVGLFVFSLIFAVMALNRVETAAHEILSVVCAMLGLTCMATFLFLIDYAARLLRPVSMLARVGDSGLKVIQSVYPSHVGDNPDVGGVVKRPDARRRVVRHVDGSGNVLAVELEMLVHLARRAGGVIEFLPEVGDFVATDQPLFLLFGDAVAIDDDRLRATVAFGEERTMEQDPLFSFRILVDIALKALSPAINDPTTAVIALDQVNRLLRAVGQRQLREEAIRDSTGELRVIYRTPNWEDFVQIACTEIPSCGANNLQIARRLRAMFDNLVATLPAHRHPPLELERRRLDRMVEDLYRLPEDLALARIPDAQGLGGSSAMRERIER